MTYIRRNPLLQLILLPLLLAGAAGAEDRFRDVEIKPVKAADGVYMLTGQGGNLGVAVGEDGVFLIDDQFAPLTEKIRTAIGSLSDQPVKYLLNTHWHPDHTGGLGVEGAFMGLPVYALADTLTAIGVDGTPILPGRQWIDGVKYEFIQILDAEAPEQLVIKLPYQGVIIVQDLAYNGLHLFLANNTLDGWIEALRFLQLSGGQKTVLVGHGYPTDTSIYRENIIYLKTAQRVVEMVQGVGTVKEQRDAFKAEMIDRFLHLDGEFIIDFALGVLFP